MASYAELITEVRAQVDVDPIQAKAWLLDRARVLNAEAGWNLRDEPAPAVENSDQRLFWPPADFVWLEAVIVDGNPYARSTPRAMDERMRDPGGTRRGIYAIAFEHSSSPPETVLRIDPPSTADTILVRYVAPIDAEDPFHPFPPDFDAALVEGAIAIGLARMDERFDSAGYFDARFVDAVSRLRRRRHGRIGRGATAIRVAQ